MRCSFLYEIFYFRAQDISIGRHAKSIDAIWKKLEEHDLLLNSKAGDAKTATIPQRISELEAKNTYIMSNFTFLKNKIQKFEDELNRERDNHASMKPESFTILEQSFESLKFETIMSIENANKHSSDFEDRLMSLTKDVSDVKHSFSFMKDSTERKFVTIQHALDDYSKKSKADVDSLKNQLSNLESKIPQEVEDVEDPRFDGVVENLTLLDGRMKDLESGLKNEKEMVEIQFKAWNEEKAKGIDETEKCPKDIFDEFKEQTISMLGDASKSIEVQGSKLDEFLDTLEKLQNNSKSLANRMDENSDQLLNKINAQNDNVDKLSSKLGDFITSHRQNDGDKGIKLELQNLKRIDNAQWNKLNELEQRDNDDNEKLSSLKMQLKDLETKLKRLDQTVEQEAKLKEFRATLLLVNGRIETIDKQLQDNKGLNNRFKKDMENYAIELKECLKKTDLEPHCFDNTLLNLKFDIDRLKKSLDSSKLDKAVLDIEGLKACLKDIETRMTNFAAVDTLKELATLNTVQLRLEKFEADLAKCEQGVHGNAIHVQDLKSNKMDKSPAAENSLRLISSKVKELEATTGKLNDYVRKNNTIIIDIQENVQDMGKKHANNTGVFEKLAARAEDIEADIDQCHIDVGKNKTAIRQLDDKLEKLQRRDNIGSDELGKILIKIRNTDSNVESINSGLRDNIQAVDNLESQLERLTLPDNSARFEANLKSLEDQILHIKTHEISNQIIDAEEKTSEQLQTLINQDNQLWEAFNHLQKNIEDNVRHKEVDYHQQSSLPSIDNDTMENVNKMTIQIEGIHAKLRSLENAMNKNTHPYADALNKKLMELEQRVDDIMNSNQQGSTLTNSTLNQIGIEQQSIWQRIAALDNTLDIKCRELQNGILAITSSSSSNGLSDEHLGKLQETYDTLHKMTREIEEMNEASARAIDKFQSENKLTMTTFEIVDQEQWARIKALEDDAKHQLQYLETSDLARKEDIQVLKNKMNQLADYVNLKYGELTIIMGKQI